MSGDSNPFEAPSTAIETGVASVFNTAYRDATNGTRFANLAVDYIANIVIGMMLGVVEVTVIGAWVVEGLWGSLFGVVHMSLYYIVLEGLTGRTLGKLVTGTRVVDEHYGHPSWGRIIGRTFARFVPFEPFSFLTSDGGWHDQWSHTRVVQVRGHVEPM